MSLDARMQAIWYGRRGISWLLLWPFSCLFYLIVVMRRWAFRSGVLRSVRVNKPVIVVGNLSVGGTGKTPLIMWLANALTQQGLKVGVITRGYGGQAKSWPQFVHAASDPLEVGDEAALIAQQTQALVFSGPDRVADAEQAIAAGAQVILSDDGLQHYRLQRDCELAVIDGSRMIGNGSLLPAGPLREPVSRLKQVNLVLLNRRNANTASAVLNGLISEHLEYTVEPTQLRSFASGALSNEWRPLDKLKGQQVHVVTGIGNPQAFIAALRGHGLNVSARLLPDHAVFKPADIEFGDGLPVLMTEKDAVKCRTFATAQDDTRYSAQHWAKYWIVGAEVVMEPATAAKLLATIQQTIASHASH